MLADKRSDLAPISRESSAPLAQTNKAVGAVMSIEALLLVLISTLALAFVIDRMDMRRL
ncbi:MAG: hypothetical protein IT537_14150 [Hyphomicrobiales bacterium]|nr:hypothetical protein [Hyphomicrobiales bacterium]